MKKKLTKLALAILIIFLGFSTRSVLAQNLCAGKSNYCYNFALTNQIPIPTTGISFLKTFGDLSTPEGIIAALFRFGLMVVGMGALVMFIIGGVFYASAGDNTSRLKQGQEYMYNAIFGLVIALLSWLILYTINPNLIQPKLDTGVLETLQNTTPTQPKQSTGYCAGTYCDLNATAGNKSCSSDKDCPSAKAAPGGGACLSPSGNCSYFPDNNICNQIKGIFFAGATNCKK